MFLHSFMLTSIKPPSPYHWCNHHSIATVMSICFIWSLSWYSYSPFDETLSYVCFLLWQILALITKLTTHLHLVLIVKLTYGQNSDSFHATKQSHPHCNFVFLWYFGTWVISIGCWTYIITLLSLHLYQHPILQISCSKPCQRRIQFMSKDMSMTVTQSVRLMYWDGA